MIAFKLFDPARTIQSMKNAHDALIVYANSKKKPKNLTDLIAELETFKNQADEIFSAMKLIKNNI